MATKHKIILQLKRLFEGRFTSKTDKYFTTKNTFNQLAARISLINNLTILYDMDILNWKNTLVVSGPVLCGLAFKLIKNRIGKQSDAAINEVLFYGADNQREKKEIGLENLLCISYVISHASKTVDVCVPSLRSESLTKCLINVHEKNKAKIRVAIHDSDHFSNLKSFAQHAIEVKVIKSAVRLEHEFILMDAAEGSSEAVALLGSLDYEAERVNCDWDTTMLTSEPAVVTNLQREFERIWNSTPEVVRANDKTN